MSAGVVHKFVANRYTSVREDGRRVEMMQVACDRDRVQIQKPDSWTCALDRVTCHDCLNVALEKLIFQAKQILYQKKHTPKVEPKPFRYSQRRALKEFRVSDPEIDREILQRLELQ